MAERLVELDEESWPALADLFGPNGAVAGCWCTWFRQTNAELRDRGADGNRELLHALVRDGRPLGLLAVEEGAATGWVAVAPRTDYARLARSKVAAPAGPAGDLAGTWAVTCFFVHRSARRRGLAARLLAGAVEFAAGRGARAVEGYPVDTAGARKPSGDLYHGTLALFLGAGFTLVERRGTRRALVRKELR